MHAQPHSAGLLADEERFGDLAEAMCRRQLAGRDITDPRVLEQMRRVPRHLFLEPPLRSRAYEDCALPTQHGQTISQPYIVALMTQMLEVQPDHHVLEIGTGSGYQTMILAHLAARVTSLETDADLVAGARGILDRFAIRNVDIHLGDGTLGYAPGSPYDRILVTAAAPRAPSALLAQLADDGRLVIPLGDRQTQHLHGIDRRGDDHRDRRGIAVRFVPLVGEQGWRS